jgi:WD40-like Beta Propeller Repeat
MLLMLLGACQIEEAGPPVDSDRGNSTNRDPERPPSTLIYVDRTTLKVHNLESGETTKITDLPSADVAVSPDGELWAAVEETSPKGPTEEGFRKPAIVVGETSGEGEPTRLGPGAAPFWAPDSSEVLATAVAKGYQTCPLDTGEGGEVEGVEEGGCVTAVRVIAYPVDGGEPRTMLGANESWQVLGLTEEDTIVAVAGSTTVAPYIVYAPAGTPISERRPLGFRPSEVWGVSPSEFRILIAKEGRPFLAAPGEGVQPPLKELKDIRLGDGEWSPDGRHIVLAAFEAQRDGVPESELTLITVESGDVTQIPDSDGAQGGVAWSADGRSFAYTRAAGRRLEAVTCSIDDLECSTAFDWGQGVRLLALR